MNNSTRPRFTVPGHIVALSALAGLAALFAYALYDRPGASRAATPERPAITQAPRGDLESWAISAQQKVLGTRFTRESAGHGEPVGGPRAGELAVAERPVTRTVTHVGVSPRREASQPSRTNRRDGWSYSGPSLANLPPPGD